VSSVIQFRSIQILGEFVLNLESDIGADHLVKILHFELVLIDLINVYINIEWWL